MVTMESAISWFEKRMECTTMPGARSMFAMALLALREQERRRLTGHEYPCDFCRFGPPSSGDGKPCTTCPAEAKEVP